MKKNYALCTAVAVVMFGLNACKKDQTTENPNKANYALSTTGGTYPNQTTYLFGSNQFPTGSLGTANAAELSSSGQMFKFGSDIYVSTFGAPATLRKFTFDDAGKPKQVGSFVVAGLKTFGAVEFVSATEAYAASNGYKGVPKLVKFNPTTMEIITTFNLTGLQKTGATEVYYLGMVIRDNYMYMGINYQDATFSNLADSVFVGVINITTNTVEKIIADGRSSEMWNGGTAASFSPNALIKDAANDIYVMGFANNAKPSGILKIKSGTTVFDASYFFNLDATVGKHCLGMFPLGSTGNILTVGYDDPAIYPFDTDASYNSVASARYYKVNLSTKASFGSISSDIPKFFGANAFAATWDNETFYLNVPSPTINAIYSYKASTNAVKKEFELSSGQCNGFTKIN